MQISLTLNGKKITEEIAADLLLIDFVRNHGCYSVKRGCETSNCGLCTVFLDEKPVLSCSVLAARADGHKVDTLEGLQEEAEEFGSFIAGQGAEQCGFCNPGMIMNAIALFRENPDPSDDEIREYLAGNLCRCSGYEGQLRGIHDFWSTKEKEEPDESSRSTIVKKDAKALVTGKPVYTNDLAPKDCLIVKLLRSPHANAMIQEIKTDVAMRVPGIEAIYTWKDVPQQRFTIAGQTWPEPSPYDRLILDQHVRFVGDPVAIIAGENEACVERAMKMIKVKYEVLPAVLDPEEALDGPILVHPEDSWKALCPVGADNKRNLCAQAEDGHGDVEKVLAECDVVVEHTYHVKAAQQAMMEPFQTVCFMDMYGRLNVMSSTQIVYHVRRIVSNALGIPKSKIRAFKPRIGGGFGAKQTAVSEVYPAFVTWKTGKPSKIVFTREESQIASSPRHDMAVTVRMGADKEGNIRAIDLYTLSNTGAYGEHGPTTVGLSGHKAIPLYGSLDAYRFRYDVVYTNRMAAGAYRGYGATQGIFAVETSVNELAEKLGMDPMEIRMKNMVKEGQFMPAILWETANSCALDKCLARVKEMSGWDEKYPRKVMPDGKIRSVGVALAMQGSCISNVDVGSATIKLGEDGVYNMSIAAADMGTGCDTILAQMAAECLDCDLDDIAVSGADTDTSPYDSGSYASSTTYVTGMAVTRAGEELKKRIVRQAAKMLKCEVDEVDFDGHIARSDKTGEEVTLAAIGAGAMCGSDIALQVTESTVRRYLRRLIWQALLKSNWIRRQDMSRSWITMQWLTAELLLTRILRGCRRKAESCKESA